MHRRLHPLLLLTLLAHLICVPARPTVQGHHGMVSCTHHLACTVGVQILERGGTALEAAVAVQLALAVVEPQHVSLLGGGGLVFRENPSSSPMFLDFREEAPRRYHPRTFCKGSSCLDPGDPECTCSDGAWPWAERCTGGHATGVPGVPGMILRLYKEGRLKIPLNELAAGAIKLASDGFEMYAFLQIVIDSNKARLCRDTAAADIFLNSDCTAPKVRVGQTFIQPLLAQTLREYFQSPSTLQSFYTGEMALEIVAAASNARNSVTGKHGVLAAADLAGYRAIYRDPVSFSYRAPDGQLYLVYGATMPFSGPLTLSLILQQLERLEWGSIRATDGVFLDAQNGAFADRNAFMGDADFNAVAVDELLSEEFGTHRYAALFPRGLNGTALHTPIPPGTTHAESPTAQVDTPDQGTSHMSIADSRGMIVALTTTVNTLMGAAVAVPARGLLLNNQLCDFDAIGFAPSGRVTINAPEGGKRARSTALAPDRYTTGGKRPRSSMTPIIFESVGRKVVGAMGAPGGTDIIGGVANVLRNLLGSGLIPEQLQVCTDAARVLGKNVGLTSGRVEWEIFNDAARMSLLHRKGYANCTTTATPRPYANGETFARVESVIVDGSRSDGVLYYAAADDTRFPPAAVKAPTRSNGGKLQEQSDKRPVSLGKGFGVSAGLSMVMGVCSVGLWKLAKEASQDRAGQHEVEEQQGDEEQSEDGEQHEAAPESLSQLGIPNFELLNSP